MTTYWDATIDRGGAWDGHLPLRLLYDGYLPDGNRYYVTVAGYAGDQITAQSIGMIINREWFSNVDRVVTVQMITTLP